MKRILLAASLLLCLGLHACQCSDKPPVGPIEDDDASAAVEADLPDQGSVRA